MADWEDARAELEAVEASVYAVSVDSLEQAREVAARGISFSLAYGATREDGGKVGAWWSEDHGGHIEPAEFLLGRGGVVLGSMYASGPVGRMRVTEAVSLINYREGRA